MRTRGLEDARRQLITALAEYAAQTGVAVTVVFDGQARPGACRPPRQHDGVTVLFGSKRASADHVIERAAYQASQRGEGADVVVATDDRLERDVVGGMGVATMGARALEAEVARVAGGVDTETKRMRDDSRRTHAGRGRARSRGAAASRAHPSRRGWLRSPHRGRSLR